MTDDELSDAARSLHREWESPKLWPAIAAEIAAIERAERNAAVRRRRWQTLAAAAAVVLAVAASVILMRDRGWRAVEPAAPTAHANAWSLSDDALSEIERAEAQYIAAIEALATKATAASNASAPPLVAHLRERLLVIDTAIADCRAEIERNRFNAHLRRQLLSMYQEKRRTLEEILKQEQHAS